METYLGMIAMFGFNFAPQGWVFCDGSLLSIAQNDALFALIGTTYGGDGMSTFAVPDLRGRIAIGQGQGPGLPNNYVMGQMGGSETAVLSTNNLPAHNHLIYGTTEPGDTNAPAGAYPANSELVDKEYKTAPTNKVLMNNSMVGAGGSAQPFSVLQPLLTINYCISIFGVFPSQN